MYRGSPRDEIVTNGTRIRAYDPQTGAELWTFDVQGDDPTARVKEILDETTLVVNPNVHRYSIGSWNDPPRHAESVRPSASSDLLRHLAAVAAPLDRVCLRTR